MITDTKLLTIDDTPEVAANLPPVPPNCVEIIVRDQEFCYRLWILKDALVHGGGLDPEAIALGRLFVKREGQIGSAYHKYKRDTEHGQTRP